MDNGNEGSVKNVIMASKKYIVEEWEDVGIRCA